MKQAVAFACFVFDSMSVLRICTDGLEAIRLFRYTGPIVEDRVIPRVRDSASAYNGQED